MPLEAPLIPKNEHESSGALPVSLGNRNIEIRQVLQSTESDKQRQSEREFLTLQIQFAREAARVQGITFAKALLLFTGIYRRSGLPPDECNELDDTNPQWQKLLSHIENEEQLVAAALAMIRPRTSDAPTESCFDYSYDETDKAVNIHFANHDRHEKGPLSDERLGARIAELKSMFAEIKQKHPEAERVRGSSWIYNVPNYRRLFPDAHVDKLGTPHGYVASMSLWGQFIDRTGGVRHDRANEFLTRAHSAKNNNELLDAFPFRELSAGCSIQNFYSFYGIA